MPKLHLHRKLRWLEIVWGQHATTVILATAFVPHRWQRFEIKARGVVVGPLTICIHEDVREPR